MCVSFVGARIDTGERSSLLVVLSRETIDIYIYIHIYNRLRHSNAQVTFCVRDMNLSRDVNTVPFARPFAEIQPQSQQPQQPQVRNHSKMSREEDRTTGSTNHNTSLLGNVVGQSVTTRRLLWWQKSIVRRSYATIETEVQNLIASSPYLHQQYHQHHPNGGENSVEPPLSPPQPPQRNLFRHRGIAKFHRDEIITGPILGKGGFSQVMEIVAFSLIPEISQQCTLEEQELRMQYASSVFDSSLGKHRYCIKHLQEKIVRGSHRRASSSTSSSSSPPNDEFQLAATDLFMESVTLSILQHENIVSLRGLPIHGLQSWKTGLYDSYFIVMDQLSTTLDKRIEEWKIAQTSSTVTSAVTATILQEKVQCAYQLALALQYLHSNRLLYRDLKPQNIGFSLQDANQIQLFDFGLCRELPTTTPHRSDHHDPFGTTSTDDIFEMSGVGTRRYMAPEIVTIGQYNQKADVYSWSMVFYEILTCIKPYVTYSTEDHTTHVCYNNERPILPLSFPYWMHMILQKAWDENISTRSSIYDVGRQLQTTFASAKDLLEKDRINNELCITNHESIMSKEYSLPNSPTGVNDFPIQTNRNDPKSDHFPIMPCSNNDNESSSESSHSFHEMQVGNDSTEDPKSCGNYCSITRNNDSSSHFLPFQDSAPTSLVDCRCGGGLVSPPPAPKRPPTTFVQVPDDVIRTFELSLSDNDDDDDDDDEDIVRIKEVSRIDV